MTGFPYHPVPDGTVWVIHHLWIGVVLALAPCRVVRDDDPDAEPWVVSNALYGVVLAFALTWPTYPPVGAALSLAGLTAATVAAVARPFWRGHGWALRAVLLAGLYIAWDDVLEHAFGWPMPLDVVWKTWLYPVVSAL